MWAAIEFNESSVATNYSDKLVKYGIIAKNSKNVFRLAPALNMNEFVMNKALSKLDECF